MQIRKKTEEGRSACRSYHQKLDTQGGYRGDAYSSLCTQTEKKILNTLIEQYTAHGHLVSVHSVHDGGLVCLLARHVSVIYIA